MSGVSNLNRTRGRQERVPSSSHFGGMEAGDRLVESEGPTRSFEETVKNAFGRVRRLWKPDWIEFMLSESFAITVCRDY